jgi:hypothetical protein
MRPLRQRLRPVLGDLITNGTALEQVVCSSVSGNHQIMRTQVLAPVGKKAALWSSEFMKVT